MKFSYADLLSAVDDFDIEGYLLDHGFQPLGTKKEEWIGTCPICGKEKLAVDVVKRGFHCWVDQEFEDYWDEREGMFKRRPVKGAGGVVALVKLLDGLETREAIRLITERSVFGNGIKELPDFRVVEAVLDANEAPAIPPPDGWRPITEPLPYMLKRGISMEDVRTFGLFWCAEGRYRNRIVFPVWEDQKLIYWQARAMWEAEDHPPGQKFTKALNPERVSGAVVSSECLMNLDMACRFPRVAIVEGPMDAIRTGPDAVCTFGKQISPSQVRRLLMRGVTAIDFMYDGPKGKEPDGAWPEMIKAAPWLSTFFDVKLVFLPHGDPADWTRDQLDFHRAVGVPAGNLSTLSILG